MLDKRAIREIALKYANEVCKTLEPKSIILFGSHINGTPNKDSDIDIAVVFSSFKGNWLETAAFLCGLKRRINLDIEPHLMDDTKDPSGFLEHIMKTGEVIYQST
jgi:predicted nucleotidyltransferase